MLVSMAFDRVRPVLRLALGLGVASLLLHPGTSRAQTLGDVEQRLDRVEKAVRRLQAGPSEEELRPPNPHDDVYQQLDRRIGALERAVSSAVSAQEHDHHDLADAVEEIRRMKGDVEARLDAVESRPLASAVPAQQPAIAASEPVATPLNADERFKQAMDYASREDWTDAEFAFDSFVASYPSDPRITDARYQLGRAFQGEGKHAQAAQIFLDLYQKHPDASFMVDNLFALGQELAALGPENTQQACDVYGEIDATHGAALSADQRARLLDRRLALKCKN